MKSRRLGRGLDFLLPETKGEGDAETDDAAREVDTELIASNPWQPRSEFDEKALDSLAASLKKLGVVQPIVVRQTGEKRYELIAGERRLLAARRAGLTKIPVIVREVSDEEMLPLALVENVQRQDLNPLERAKAFLRLSEQGLSHQKIADLAGLARSTVSNSLRLLDLEPAIQEAIRTGAVTEGHARALLAESDSERRAQLLEDLLQGDLNVRQVEDRSSLAAPGKQKRKAKKKTSEARVLEKKLSEGLGLRVEIQERGSRGKVVIRYQSLEDFDHLYRTITGEQPDV